MDTALVKLQVGPLPNLSGAHTDAALVELWLRQYRSVETKRKYRSAVERLLDTIGKPLAAITLDDLYAYQDTLTHLAPASQRQAVMAVKSLFGFAAKTGYLRYNIAAAYKAPKSHSEIAQRILSEGEVIRLIHAAKRERDKAILELLYTAGLRVSELCNLRWDDIRVTEKGHAVLAVLGKGEKLRYVPIKGKLYAKLLALRAKRPGCWVFSARGDKPMTTQAVRYIVAQAAKRAGLDKIPSPHWLRHCHATHALNRGFPLTAVSATLGHSSVAVTSRYLHADPSMLPFEYLPDV